MFLVLYTFNRTLKKDIATNEEVAAQYTEYPAEYPAVPRFSLLASDGRVIDGTSMEGRYAFLFFGYTHCPDICYPTLQSLNQAIARLAENGSNPPLALFIAVDQDVDDQAAVAHFIADLPNIVGIPAGQADAGPLQEVLGVYAHKRDDSMFLDHTEGIILIDPDRKPIAYLPASFTAKNLEQSFFNIISKE